MVYLMVWAILSPVAGLLAGWAIAKYGHGRCEPRAVLKPRERELLAVELARANKMEIRK